MVYILCITFWKCQDTPTLFGTYLVLTYIERLSRLPCFCWSVKCMSQVSKLRNFFLTCSETEERLILKSF